MAGVLDSVNQRTQLVGQNRLELLLFRLDGEQLYGINVFKVREVLQCPRLTIMPKCGRVVRGVASIRGSTLPILDLSLATGKSALMNLENSFAVITEYNNRTLGFLVSSVERIVNLNWEAILPPPRGAGRDHYLTAVTHIDNKLVEIIDVEKVLAEVAPTSEEVSPEVVDDDTRAKALSCRVLVVDDSSVARKQITRCLENIGIEVVKLNDGREALNYLKRMADEGKNPAEEFLMMNNDSALANLRALPLSNNPSLKTATPADASLDITEPSLLTTSDYLLEFDGSVPGSGYRARRLSDNQPITVSSNGGVLTFTDANGRDQGFTVQVTGTSVIGDKFTLQPTRRGASDIRAVLDQADQLAFAAPMRANAELQNAGSGVIGQPSIVNEQTPLVPAHLKEMSPVTLTYAGPVAPATTGTFTLSAPAGVTVSPATLSINPGQNNTLSYTVAYGGSSVEISQTFSGRPVSGDQFKLEDNPSGVSDNRNALKLVDLQTKQTVGVTPGVAGSGFSFTDGYGELVERVGTLTAQARMDSEATGAILKQATDNRDSLSAVNLDEEAANLIKFEQYYNASAQIIQVARSLFDTLINSFR